jgi:hypothetical protein
LPFRVKLMAMAASCDGKPIVQQVAGWVEMVEISLSGARMATLLLALANQYLHR